MKQNQLHHFLAEQLRAAVPFSEEEIIAISALATKKTLAKGEKLLQKGEHCDSTSLVCSGIIRQFYLKKDGKEFTSKFYFKNDWIGNIGCAKANNPPIYTLEAVQRSEVLIFKIEDLDKLLDKSHRFERYARLMIQRMYCDLLIDKANRILLSPEEQYLYLLQEQPEMFTFLSLKQIAQYMNIEPGSLSRIRKRIASTNTMH